jgi:hypothetical protein
MTNEQLRAVMRFQLSSFNDEGVEITDTVIHSQVLSDSDGFSTGTSSKAAYKAFVRNTLSRNGHADAKWPVDWLNLSVTDLAAQLIEEEVV